MFGYLIYNIIGYIKYVLIFWGGLATRQQPFLPKIKLLESITWYHVLNKDKISLLCVAKRVALVWSNFRKLMSKEVDYDIFPVPSNNEWKIPRFLGSLNIKFYLKKSLGGLNQFSFVKIVNYNFMYNLSF